MSNATVGPDAQADVPAHEEDNARGVHQEDPAGDAHEEDGRGGEAEFHHGLTMDEGETHYWSFPEQLWFPLTMNDSGDFYWNYPEQTWSRFKWNVCIYLCMHSDILFIYFTLQLFLFNQW